MSKSYPSDMTDEEWEIISPMIPQAKKGGRPRSVDLRSIINAIFYVVKGGIQWRMLPKEFPAWGTVYWYFRQWTKDGTIEKIHDKLRKITRVTANKKPEATGGIIDSQSVKAAEEAKMSGFDAGKKRIRAKFYHKPIDPLHRPTAAMASEAKACWRNA